VQQQVHHAEAMRVGYKLGTGECIVPLEKTLVLRQLVKIVQAQL